MQIASQLHISKNGKAGGAWDMPAVDSCPGATAACLKFISDKPGAKMRKCYATQSRYRMAQPAYKRNMRLIKASIEEHGIEITAQALVLCIKMHKNSQISLASGAFRFHGSGDVWSSSYGMVLHAVAEKMSNINFWMYTRSYVEPLILPSLVQCAMLPNFDVWLSADYVNYKDALDTVTSNTAFSGIACMAEADAQWIKELAVLDRRQVVTFREHVMGKYAPIYRDVGIPCPELSGAFQTGLNACLACKNICHK